MMQRVRDDLRAAGLVVWTDEGIEPGSISWKEAIEQAIRDTGAVIVLLSPDANDSRWVQREIDYAEVLHKMILPLLIRGNEEDAIPFALAGSQFIDLRHDYQNGLVALLSKCYDHLPPSLMPTVPTRTASITYDSPRTRRKRKRRQIQQLFASAVMVGGVIVMMLLLLIRPNADEPPYTNTDEPENTNHNITLIYNQDTLTIHNHSSDTISLDNVSFEIETDKLIQFEAHDWITQTLDSERCVQVWDIRFNYVSAPDICRSRVAYRASVSVFWVSNRAEANFTIKKDGDVLAQCPAIRIGDENTIYCSITL